MPSIAELTAKLESEFLRLHALRDTYKSLCNDINFPHNNIDRLKVKTERLMEIDIERATLVRDIDILNSRADLIELEKQRSQLVDVINDCRDTIASIKATQKIESVAAQPIKTLDKLLAKATPEQLQLIVEMLNGGGT